MNEVPPGMPRGGIPELFDLKAQVVGFNNLYSLVRFPRRKRKPADPAILSQYAERIIEDWVSIIWQAEP